ncbi:MAG: triose-phosphate isomerase family protein [Candidatus Levyibacteriota bacterium]
MKKLFIVANWKSNKTQEEAKEWFGQIATLLPRDVGEKELILCVPASLFSVCKESINKLNLPIQLGAQDVSPFENGPYTGAISATMLAEFVTHVLIGHSERRINFHEDDEMLFKKVLQAKQAGLTPIYLVQGKDTPIPDGVDIVGYEPVAAIGSGNPDTPENVIAVAHAIKENKKIPYVLYGGSVNGENVHTFTSLEGIHGVIPGNASLDPHKLAAILINA